MPASQRTLWESFTILPRKTRLVISGSIFGVGLIGLGVSDWLEKKYPAGTGQENTRTESTSSSADFSQNTPR